MNYLFILVSLFAIKPFHAGHIAEYYYKLEENQLSLKFVIEKAELFHYPFEGDCDIESMTALCVVQYLNKRSSIQINNEIIEMELHNSYSQGDHFIVNLRGEWNGGSVNKIIIHNDCFYEFDAKFKNRMIMDVGRFKKSYLMNKKQTILELN
jgi:hypothetical protein